MWSALGSVMSSLASRASRTTGQSRIPRQRGRGRRGRGGGALLGGYAAESRQCDAVVTAAQSLDVVSVQRNMSLRWILLHLIEETARHLGHIDVLREQADGSTGEEPGQ